MNPTIEQMNYVLEAFKATVNALAMMNKRIELIEEALGIEDDSEDTVDNDTLQDKMFVAVKSI